MAVIHMLILSTTSRLCLYIVCMQNHQMRNKEESRRRAKQEQLRLVSRGKSQGCSGSPALSPHTDTTIPHAHTYRMK